MASRPSFHISDLRRKIDVVKALYSISRDSDFAKLIGVSGPALAVYFNGPDGRENYVPEERLTLMAKLVADRGGRLSHAQAKLAWLAPFEVFYLAVGPRADTALEQLLDGAEKRLTLGWAPVRDGMGAIDDDCVDAANATSAALGARFQIVIANAPPGAFLVVLVAAPDGWYFAAPRAAQALRFGPSGQLRAPDHPLRFTSAGHHRFIAFAIDAPAPPRLLARREHRSALEREEREQFAADLKDRVQTRGFVTGELEIFVLSHPRSDPSPP